MTEVRRISDSIMCVRRASYQTCSYIVRMSAGLVLLDAGMSSDGADVHAGLTELNAHTTDIRAILLTHWHNDHAAGAQTRRGGRGRYWDDRDDRTHLTPIDSQYAQLARFFRRFLKHECPESRRRHDVRHPVAVHVGDDVQPTDRLWRWPECMDQTSVR